MEQGGVFDIILILGFSFYIFISGKYIFRKNILFGILYFFLFVYSIFTQIGYCFFPEFSSLINAYFGKKYFYIFFLYNTLSFVFFHLLFCVFYDKIKRFKKYNILYDKSVLNYLMFSLFLIFYYSYLFFYFVINYDSINYQNASDPNFLESSSFFYKVFAVFFKSLVGYGTILYIQFRLKESNKIVSFFSKRVLLVFNFINLFFLILISFRIGSRTDILAFIIAVCIFEYIIGLNRKKIVLLFTCVICAFLFLLFLESFRLGDSVSDNDVTFVQKLLLKDYFAPAHLLYTAIFYDFINPLFVLKSNFSNSIILLNVDYLQMPVTELIAPGVATRSQGYAFYLFTEGFLFMGIWGFIYNSLMLFMGLFTWFLIYNSSFKPYRIMILTIMCSQVANLARSQSSYFYKDILVIFLPIFLFIYLSSGLRPKFF